MGATYLDGLLKALEVVRSYSYSGAGETANSIIHQISNELELEMMRYRREREGFSASVAHI